MNKQKPERFEPTIKPSLALNDTEYLRLIAMGIEALSAQLDYLIDLKEAE